MFVPSHSDAAASTASAGHTATDKTTALPLSSAAGNPPPGPQLPREQVRHLLFGTPGGIQTTIQRLHKLGYAEPNDWSRPLPTGRPNELMAILTKRINPV